MGKENLTFNNIEIEKKNYHHKTPICFGDLDIEKLLVSNKISFGGKNYNYFIGYSYISNTVQPLNIMLPNTSAYVSKNL